MWNMRCMWCVCMWCVEHVVCMWNLKLPFSIDSCYALCNIRSTSPLCMLSSSFSSAMPMPGPAPSHAPPPVRKKARPNAPPHPLTTPPKSPRTQSSATWPQWAVPSTRTLAGLTHLKPASSPEPTSSLSCQGRPTQQFLWARSWWCTRTSHT